MINERGVPVGLRLRREIGAATHIVLLSVGAAVSYGILHDQVTAHVCVEYFTIGHIDYLNLGNATLIAFEWGLLATWWAGLIIAVPVTLTARLGTRRPPVSAYELLRPTLVLMGCTGLISFIAGVTGYFFAQAGDVYLLEPLASEVPRAKHVAFLTDLWAHNAAYVTGIVGCMALCVWTWRRRTILGRAVTATRGSNQPLRRESASAKSWESATLRFLTVVGCCSLVLGTLFILAISALSGI